MKNKKYYYIFIFSSLFFLTFAFTKIYSDKIESENKISIYPSLYNKKELSASITEADKRFVREKSKNKTNLIANVKESISRKKEIEPDYKIQSEEKHGTWLWTPINLITKDYKNEIIKNAKSNNINTIYLSIDSYLDIYSEKESIEKSQKLEEFDNIISDFIKTANIFNIEVEALSGWKNWAEPEHTYKPFVIMDYVINFNERHQEKFVGIQYDIEPYLLDEYKKDKKYVLKNFLSLMKDIFDSLPKDNSLYLSVVIPEFFDKTSKETPKFLWNGGYNFTLGHLLRIMKTRENSRLIVMAYRNFTTGYDGVFDISKDEVYEAEKSKVRVIIAQETGDFPPSYITYHNTTRQYYDKKIEEIKNFYKENENFTGIATHYLNSFIELR